MGSKDFYVCMRYQENIPLNYYYFNRWTSLLAITCQKLFVYTLYHLCIRLFRLACKCIWTKVSTKLVNVNVGKVYRILKQIIMIIMILT